MHNPDRASNRVSFVVLGAGRPQQGEQHTALRGTSKNSRVLDWVLQAVAFLQPTVTFVGGYQIDEVTRRYPDFHYVINPDWEETGAAVSLLDTPLQPNADYFISYADILYRELLVRQMVASDAAVVVAVDSAWRQRFQGRTEEDLARCEKVTCFDGKVTRLGSDIDPLLADAEFIGLARLSADVVELLDEEKPLLRDRLKQGNLAQLVEYLRTKGVEVAFVDVAGDWAELNEPKDLAHFVLGTKAQTLHRLQSLVKCSRIEDQVSFSVAEWEASGEHFITQITQAFPSKSLVVRSSALSEDGFGCANAGAYTSILNVSSSDCSAIRAAVDKVISSYTDNNPVNQVLVQPMVKQVLASGVAFTRTLAQGAPYFVINYDDVTQSTESITSGASIEHKTLLVHRGDRSDLSKVPELVHGLLSAIREIENLLGFESLDIEFAIGSGGKVHILQVRPIAVDHSNWAADHEEIDAVIKEAELRFEQLQMPTPFVVGEKAIFGLMPDWNPAEIIGTNPGRLASSLYRYLIMDDVWATQRAEYGYRDVRPQPLLTSFCGRPYVDVRASFNSFIPAELDDAVAKRLVDFYLDWLERYPHLHDKVEFDVVPTCYDLDFSRWAERLIVEGPLTKHEVELLGNALLKITINALDRNDQELESIARLESRYNKLQSSQLAPLEKATALLEDAKRYGTLAFSHLARNAFVAVALLRSAVTRRVIDQPAVDAFMQSIRTVSHQFTHDAAATSQGELSWSQFCSIYGHLRPGTYDITSPSYAADPERFLRPVVDGVHELVEAPPAAWIEQRDAFARACTEAGLPGDIEQLEKFIRQAIEGREYAKFVFTRNVSAALDELSLYGGRLGLSLDELSAIPLCSFFAVRSGSAGCADTGTWLKAQAQEGGHERNLSGMIEVPPLIRDPTDFRVFMYPSSQPNYVGTERIVAECADLNGQYDEEGSLAGKIALIPQADPGYDWLFGQNIAGLITMYGGANSHMAIRAAEFGLPAAIGVGETEYQRLSFSAVLELDTANRRIQVIR
ncbi:PEP/pyruvate-binding domain-containing protein [Motiliproteus sp.]|uniref:PEP/pyruvate-binding domain-containing protein n=1 Tax=Motiliproteus sp. TaxID=1898955 RepID=UPI003BAA2304